MDYISCAEAAKKWGISERRVQKLCEVGRIPGAVKLDVYKRQGYTFTAKGKTTLCEGWREIEKLSRAASEEQDEDAEPETVLPPLAEGQTFDLSLIHI